MPLFDNDPARFDAALLRFQRPHILQSSQWAHFKAPIWSVQRQVWGDEASPLAAASILTRKLGPLPIRIQYAPKGPVVRPELAAWHKVLPELEAHARASKALFIKIDPDIDAESALGRALIALLQQRGWVFSADQVQFRNTVLSDLSVGEEMLLASMKQKTRYNIRLAGRRGVVVAPSGDFDTFYELYAETAARDGFLIRPRAYYLQVMRTLQRAGMGQLLLARVEKAPVAGLFLFRFGPTAWYFYGASSSQGRRNMPTYLLQWEALRWAMAQGCTTYDWWGAPNELDESDPMWGVYRFKEGFGGRFTRWIGAWDYAPNRMLYRTYTGAMPKVLDLMRRRHG
jgi:lipid II:glycine glycyltransferase (peptidoglycan interpeptide bridge formation enzyme)